MTPRDMALGVLTSVIWGGAFIAIKIGLDSFSPPQLTALRFIIACLPILLVLRPKVAWPLLIAIGLTLFTGQFLLLFFAFKAGLPPGVASVTQPMQAFFTAFLAAIFLGEVPGLRHYAGMAVALVGLALIGLTFDANLTALGVGLGLASAFSWAVGNVLVKRLTGIPMLPLMVWLSLVPPLPSLAVSAFFDPDPLSPSILFQASWASLLAAIYLGAVSTVLAYAIWGGLLARNSAADVAPFALIVPCVGVIGSWLAFGESFGPLRMTGMGLILAGVAIVVLSGRANARVA